MNLGRGNVYGVDEDGDLILPRRRSKIFLYSSFILLDCNFEVSSSTNLPLVLVEDFITFLVWNQNCASYLEPNFMRFFLCHLNFFKTLYRLKLYKSCSLVPDAQNFSMEFTRVRSPTF